ncbi:MAG TPA: hypothetical protein VGQ76_10560 [Thermoanaerobaculia bacterium]|jgi:hypothetical protein|nr:hypothetical protein [Thermoanaerobaculia bacterium]
MSSKPGSYLHWLTAALFILCLASAVQGQGLRVVSTTLGPDPNEVTYVLENTSGKIVTAWEFACMSATHAGKSARMSVNSHDAYFEMVTPRSGSGVDPNSRLIWPGERTSRVVPIDPASDGPYAARTCGPLAVIFEDGTFEGPAARAEAMFADRAKTAIESYQALSLFEAERSRGANVEDALRTIIASEARTASDPRGVHFGAERLRTFLDQPRADSPVTAEEVVANLRRHYEGAVRHLSESWRLQVAQEVAR